MRIADVLRNKGAGVLTIAPDTLVSDLLRGLVTRNVGAMVVVGPDGVIGIVSERAARIMIGLSAGLTLR